MSNYPDGSNTKDAPWNWVPPKPIPFDELRLQKYSFCRICDKNDVWAHGQMMSQLACKECYDREPEYYEDDN